ncbi:MAG: CHC2 zinc finger domain-containing protein [Akkermansiaceae bacterium]|jgi:DNA primase
MARLPEELVERIKREVPLEDLCRDYGIELSGSGKNLLGKCPFHEDDEPSFAVTPNKNLWNCLAGCGGGDNIKLVMDIEKISFRRAADKLAAKLGIVPEAQTVVTHTGTTHDILTDPGDGLSDVRLMNIVTDFYHTTFLNQPQAMQYLAKRKCFHPEAAKRFKIGYANRTLGYRVPKTTKAGQDLKTQLTKLGIYGEKGHEHLNGSVVFPVFDRHGNPIQMYGRKVNDHLRKGTPPHLYLQQPKRGIWNREGIEKQTEWLLCESIIDALTLWCHGFRNVTTAFGVNGFNADLWRMVEEVKPKRVVICYDNDDPGNKAAAELSQRLAEKGIGTLRVRLPDGCDINRLAIESNDAQKALAAALEGSQTLVALAQQTTPTPQEPSFLVAPELAAPAKPEPASEPPQDAPPDSNKITFENKGPDELHAVLGDRAYRVRGLARNLSYETIKVQLKVTFAENSPTGSVFHLDNALDLCSAKAREHFIKAAAEETKLRPDILKRDLGRLLLALEELQEEHIRKATEPKTAAAPKLADEERDEAAALLADPNLLDRILADFDTCGLVGEDTNKLVGYLAATSRKFEKPLGVIIQSTSAAGKTTLMEAILAMMPEEERVQYSAMTGQALYYLGEIDIRHKILAIAEEEGAERASYALKLLQSEGEVSIVSTGKDATTGRMQAEVYRAEGPTQLMLTTTSIEVDEELQNRCLVLTVDESREQTRRIHQLQREARTLEGLERKRRRAIVRRAHQNAQRLLRPLEVINPFAPRLTFPDENTRLRRDQEKYLTLIDAIAFLHQYQRPVKERGGRSYIEVTLTDIETANRIAGECFGRTLDEMPPQTRRFLELLWKHVKETSEAKHLEPAQVRFSQRDIREQTRWSQMQVKRHLAKLAELEYLIIHSGGRGQQWRYELIYRGEGQENERFLLGLIDTANLSDDGNRGAQNDEWGISGAPQGHSGGRGGSPPEKPRKLSSDKASSAQADENAENTQEGGNENAA